MRLHETRFAVQRTSSPWEVPTTKGTSQPRTAAVSSFGIGGTNAHLVAQEYIPAEVKPVHEPSRDSDPGSVVLLSAMTPPALAAARTAILRWMEHNGDEVDILDVERTLAATRRHFPHRVAIVCSDIASAHAALAALPEDPSPATVARKRGSGQVIMALSDFEDADLAQGPDLYHGWPEFKLAVDECSAASGFDCASFATNDAETYWRSQFTLTYALAMGLVRSFNLDVAAVAAAGVGQFVAGTLSGVMPLGDAMWIAEHARVVSASCPITMVSAQASELRMLEVTAAMCHCVSLVCVNNKASTCVYSGTEEALEELVALTSQVGIHSDAIRGMPSSSVLEAAKAKLEAPVRGWQTPSIPTAVSGLLMKEHATQLEEWLLGLTRASSLHRATCTVLELVPGSTVVPCGALAPGIATACSPLQLATGASPWQRVLATVASVWACGAKVDWEPYLEKKKLCYVPRAVALPTYQFDRVPCWPSKRVKPVTAAEVAAMVVPSDQPVTQDDLTHRSEWVLADPLPPLMHAMRRMPTVGIDSASIAVVTTQWPSTFAAGGSIDEVVAAAALCGQLLVVAGAPEDLGAVDLDAQTGACTMLLTVVQKLASTKCACKLWLASSGALQYASVWGLAKAIALEHPELGFSRVVYDSHDLSGLFEELRRPSTAGEDEVRWVGGVRQVARFVQSPVAAPGKRSSVDPEGTYMVTGGKRGLGLATARHLVEAMGARNLMLLGRHATSEAAAAMFASWREAGCRVLEISVDIADKGALAEVFEEARTAMPTLKGIIHCAGVVDDGIALKLDHDRTRFVLAPKVAVWNLHQLAAEGRLELDFMLLFSSTASIWGTAGQSTYCAGNAFLDQFAEWRSATLGQRTVAIQWGGWDEVGMSVDLGITPQNGEVYLLLRQGLPALEAILAESLAVEDPREMANSGKAVVAVINVQDTQKYREDPALFLTPYEPRVELWDYAQSTPVGAGGGAGHPLLGVPTHSPCSVHIWEQTLGARMPGALFLEDHVLDGARIFPAMAYLDMFLSAAAAVPGIAPVGSTVTMRSMRFVQPLQVATGETRIVQTLIDQSSADNIYAATARVSSCRSTDSQGTWVVHATCKFMVPCTQGNHDDVNLCGQLGLTSDDGSRRRADALYHEFKEGGFAYGPAFAVVRDVWKEEGQVVARIQPHVSTADSAQHYCVHPATMDACSQIVSLLHKASFSGVPSSIAEVQVAFNSRSGHGEATSECWSKVTATGAGTLDMVIQMGGTASHTPLIRCTGFELAEMRTVGEHVLYETTWRELDLVPRSLPTDTCPVWLIVHMGGQSGHLANSLVASFAQLEHGTVDMLVGKRESVEGVAEIPDGAFTGVLFCHTAAEDDDDGDDMSAEDTLWQLTQDSTLFSHLQPGARFWVITSSSNARSGGSLAIATLHSTACALWASTPAALCSIVELPHCAHSDSEVMSATCQLLQSVQAPMTVAWRDSGFHTPQLAPCIHMEEEEDANDGDHPIQSEDLTVPDDPFIVEINPSKGIGGIHLNATNLPPPGPGEVQIDTDWWALNFRDVLIAVGAIPTDTAGRSLGMGGECSGRVVSVGAGVTGLSVGDHVIACPSDGFGSLVNTPVNFVFPSPEGMEDQTAVAITMVYATAWLALKKLGRVAAGETVLVHSAAGGVGLCAVHIALAAGCTVFATASTPEKREYLEGLGVSMTWSSRDLGFVQGIQEATNGVGVDVALNSLAGAAMVKTMESMAPFGRFVEIGKRDQYEDTHVSLAPFLRGLTYSTAHLDVLMIEQPKVARAIMLEVWREVRVGALPPLPSCVYTVSRLPAALRYMSEGKHIGKILVSMRQENDGWTAVAVQPRVVAAMLHVVCGLWDASTAWIASKIASTVPTDDDVLVLACPSDPAAEAHASVLIARATRSVKVEVCCSADEVARHLTSAGSTLVSLVHCAVTTACHEMSLAVARHLHGAASAAPGLESFVTLAPAMGGLLSGVYPVTGQRDHRVALYALLHTLAKERATAGGIHSAALSVCVDVPKLHEPLTGWHSARPCEETALLASGLERTPLDQLWEALKIRLRSPCAAPLSAISLGASSCHCQDTAFLGGLVHQSRGESTTKSPGIQMRECVSRYIARHIGAERSSVDLGKAIQYYGLDSLSLIGLASQLRTIVPGASVLDIMEHKTIDGFIHHLTGSVEEEEELQQGGAGVPLRLLVLHGFRTSREIMEMQMQPVVAATLAHGVRCECVYAQAPHRATGPADEDIPAGMDVFEWWGEWGAESNKEYLTAWQGPHCDGLEASLAHVEGFMEQHGPFDGLIGFSQGAALAALVLARQEARVGRILSQLRFAVLFSGVSIPPQQLEPLKRLPDARVMVPSLHVYDANEDFVHEMRELLAAFEAEAAVTVLHSEGHVIPKSAEVCEKVVAFLSQHGEVAQ